MNRRDLLKGFLAATATVAIGLRLAKGMPPIDLKDAIKTWKWELATDNYFYGLDTLKPWQVEIYKRLGGDEWELMEAQDLMAMAEDAIIETDVKVANRPGRAKIINCGQPEWMRNEQYVTHEDIVEFELDPLCEEMEAASTIAVSQGFAALRVEGGPHIINGDHGVYGMTDLDVYGMTDLDVVRVPRIYETKQALFRHG